MLKKINYRNPKIAVFGLVSFLFLAYLIFLAGSRTADVERGYIFESFIVTENREELVISDQSGLPIFIIDKQ